LVTASFEASFCISLMKLELSVVGDRFCPCRLVLLERRVEERAFVDGWPTRTIPSYSPRREADILACARSLRRRPILTATRAVVTIRIIITDRISSTTGSTSSLSFSLPTA
jgi:hypothetical protein